MTDLSALDALHAAATPGPYARHRAASTAVVSAAKDQTICSTGGYANNTRDPVELMEELQANADLIVALHNAYPALAAEVRDLRKAVLAAQGLIADLRALLDECREHLKAGETPAECIQRNRDDATSTLNLLAKERAANEALRGRVADLEATLDLIADHPASALSARDCADIARAALTPTEQEDKT